MSENVRKCTKIELLFNKEKTLETLIFQGFSAYETRGIRTPDNLIKSQLKTPHLCGLQGYFHRLSTAKLMFASKIHGRICKK